MTKKTTVNVENPNGWKVSADHWNVKSLYNKSKRGYIDFDSHVQRGDVWDIPRRSLYIHSLLSGMLAYNIPYLYSKDGNIYHCIDGKQRGTALIEYINNRYPLKGILGEKVYCEEKEEWVEINNKKFSQLEQEFQEKIFDFSLSVAIIESTTDEPVSDEVEAEFFKRANAGKPVSKADIAMSTSKCADAIKEIIGNATYDAKGKPVAGENFFMDAYGEKRFKAGTLPKEIVLKAYYMLYPEKLGGENQNAAYFSFAKLSQISKDALIADDEKQRLIDIFNTIFNARQKCFNAKKEGVKQTIRRATGKNIMLAYIPSVDKFKDAEQLGEWWLYCLSDISEELEGLIKEGTSSLIKANKRQEIIDNSINDFLKNYDKICPKFKDMGIDIRIGEGDQLKLDEEDEHE